VIPHSAAQVGFWTVLCLYLPMLGVVWLRGCFTAGKMNDPAGEGAYPALAESAWR
jgi:hypothetical protein